MPPIRIAAELEPGIPKLNTGTRAVLATALFAASGAALPSGGGYGHGGYGGGGHYGGAPGQETNVTNNYYGDAQGQGGSGFDMGNGGGGFAPDQQSGWADTGGGFDMGDAGGGGFDGGGDFGGGGGDW